MTTKATGGWLGKLRLSRKLALVPAVFIAGAGITLAYTVTMLLAQDDDTFIVDIASRERLLNEQYLRNTILASIGKTVNRDAIRTVLTDTAQMMISGGKVIAKLGSPGLREIGRAPTPEIREEVEKNLKSFELVVAEAEKFLAQPKNSPAYASALDRLVQLSAQSEAGFKFTVKAYVKHFENRSDVMLRWEVGIFSTVAIFGTLLSWILSGSIVTPLNEVVRMAQGIANGDLRQQKLGIQTQDEIGDLARVFDLMIDSLRDLAGQNISISKNLGAAAAQVLASVQEQAAATKQQAASVQETTTTMEEISQSGAQIAERAKQVATAAEAAVAVSTSGVAAVQSTNQSMVGIRSQVESVAENIVTLSERNQAIAEIISTVNDIAEQSNLLALNAAIEAAAAGDQGRSFSVVANEIKNLAEQAKESTVQVRAILNDIQKGINSSVMLTEEAVKRAESGKLQSNVAEQTILQLSGTTEDSVRAFQQIVGATNQQQIGFEQITQALKAIRQGAEQTAASTNQLEKAALSMNALGQQLQLSASRYQI